MYIHDRRRLLTPTFPNIILDHRTPLAVSPGIVSLQEKIKEGTVTTDDDTVGAGARMGFQRYTAKSKTRSPPTVS